jgi:ABC-type enterochelin transport system permease subunit
MPMYAVIAACLSVIALGLALPRWAGLSIIALLFAAPWLDFAGMWLTKLASPRFAIVTLAGGWAMALGYLIVAVLATYQMWWRKT